MVGQVGPRGNDLGSSIRLGVRFGWRAEPVVSHVDDRRGRIPPVGMVVYDQALLNPVVTQVLLELFEERDQQFHVRLVDVRARLVEDGEKV